MPSPQHEAVVAMLQAQPIPAEIPEPQVLRSMFEMMAAMFPVPEGVRQTRIDAGGVAAEWIEMPGSSAERIVLYLHGGGYVIGSIQTHRSLVARIARDAGARCLAVEYRLAPEHPFPAALDDALAAYRFLVGSGISPAQIVIAGDSAGGGLTLATLLALRDAGEPLPAGAVCLSPWTDLEGTGASHSDPSIDDPMINLPGLRAMGRLYGGNNVSEALVSPVHADYRGLPPLLVFVGTREMLLDDSRRVVAKAKEAGVDVTLVEREGLIHVWPMFGDSIPEAADAVEQIGQFVKARTAR